MSVAVLGLQEIASALPIGIRRLIAGSGWIQFHLLVWPRLKPSDEGGRLLYEPGSILIGARDLATSLSRP